MGFHIKTNLEKDIIMAITAEEAQLIKKLTTHLEHYVSKNIEAEIYYEGKNKFKNLRIGIPKALEGLKIAVSWGEIVVEALNDRINLEGFYSDNDWVNEMFLVNHLDLKSNLAHRDALIFGTCYLLAQPGNTLVGEPEVLISTENPNQTFGEVNPRTNQLNNLLQVYIQDGIKVGVLTLPNETIYFQYLKNGQNNKTIIFLEDTADYVELGRNEHGLGFIPAVKIVNRPRASRQGGQSEITHPIRNQIDEAVRSYVGAATAREFYAAPQRYLLNVDLEQFRNPDGTAIDGLEAYMDKYIIAGKNADGSNMQAGQFTASSPTAFIEMIKQYAIEISAATGIPINMLGYQNSNPASAEAIEAQQVTLAKHGEDRTKSFGYAWQQIMRYASILAGQEVSGSIRPKWRNTRITASGTVAQADAVTKLVGAGVFTPDSEIVLELLGLNETQKQVARTETKAAKLLGLESTADILRRQNEVLNNQSLSGE